MQRGSSQILALVCACVGGIACDRTEETVGPGAVATVNGEPIHAAGIARLLRRFRLSHGDLAFRSEQDLATVRLQLVEDRINEVLLLQAARKKNIKITNDDVERALLRKRADYPGRTFEEHLAAEGITGSDLRARTKDRLTLQAFLAREVNARVAVLDHEVIEYFEQHPDEFDLPEQVHVRQIVVKTEEEGTRLLDQIKKREDFAELARKYSIAPEAAQGGDLGWFGRGIMPPPIEDTAFSLRVGKVSKVVESPYGYHLFKLLEKRGPAKSQLDDALISKIESRLRRKKEQIVQDEFRARLRASATIEIHHAALAEVR